MDYNYSYNYADPSTAAATAGSLLVLLFIYFLVFVVVYVVMALLLGQIFKKAGVPQWIAWVPVYNSWKMYELGGQGGYWAVLAFIPFVNIVAVVFLYIAMYRIGLNFGKSGAFVLWAIFVPIVWYIWLAVDKSKWGDRIATTNA